MKVLMVEPGKAPYELNIDNSLIGMQAAVGGLIEAIYPYEDPVALICDEEGKFIDLPLNRTIYDGEGNMCDVIAGPFLICGLGEETFESLSDELMEKYRKKFATPERFAHCNDDIINKTPYKRTCSIYQLDMSNDVQDLLFQRYETLEKAGLEVDINNYKKIYTTGIGADITLEDIFYVFNEMIPYDFKGHSLSVSDVIVITEKDSEKAYYIDSFDFKELPNFLGK